MVNSNLLKNYFHFSVQQLEQFEKLEQQMAIWNSQINVISRKDMEHFMERHVLHSLSIFKFLPFQNGSQILDLGTGGGFPGIPLAIAMPHVEFFLVDSIGKKIKVVNEIVAALNLKNVRSQYARVESVNGKFDFVVSRAVAPTQELLAWTRNKYATQDKNGIPNGLICLKGGDLSSELGAVQQYHEVHELKTFFVEDFFDTKKIVYVEA
ncbi:MAG: 16S rRNA (guanine(527)-N(7))-methyltransferase RsmG [Bacteroidota bacterium]